MNPAPSIVLFTTASGAGYGLLACFAVLRPFGLVPHSPAFAVVTLGLALALITLGLLSSLAHLGHPERAWRALSQWRSSWLSREGVAAIATYLLAAVFAHALFAGNETYAALAGFATVAGAAVTVHCTGMIYASLNTVRQWRHRAVPRVYYMLAIFTGSALLAALAAFWDRSFSAAWLAAIFGGVAMMMKRNYWRDMDAPRPPDSPSIESATGLGRVGTTRPLDPPHTEQNWLLREMGFRVARKHRLKLRRLVLVGFGVAVALSALSPPLHGATAALALIPAALLALAATLVERWLMFAEATHTVTLYYTGEG